MKALRLLALRTLAGIAGLGLAASVSLGYADVTRVEAGDYRVLFAPSGDSRKIFNLKGQHEPWIEMKYKLVSLKEDMSGLFDASGWLAVEFRDEDGFALASDAVQRSEMQLGREYFGAFWIKRARVKKLAGAAVTHPPLDRIEKIRARKQRVLDVIAEIDTAEAHQRGFDLESEPLQDEDARQRMETVEPAAWNESGQEEGADHPSEPEALTEEDSGEAAADPFDDPDRIREDDVAAEVARMESESQPTEVENLPPLPGSITGEDVTEYNAEMTKEQKPSLEFTSSP